MIDSEVGGPFEAPRASRSPQTLPPLGALQGSYRDWGLLGRWEGDIVLAWGMLFWGALSLLLPQMTCGPGRYPDASSPRTLGPGRGAGLAGPGSRLLSQTFPPARGGGG